jgi:hypothetical protein
MKFSISIFLVAIAAIAIFASCKKDKKDPVTAIEGRWVGEYVNNSDQSYYYSFDIKSDGTIQEINGQGVVIGEGTWEMENNILTASYFWGNGDKFSVIGSFHPELGKILGNWGYDESVTNGGTWEMVKQ